MSLDEKQTIVVRSSDNDKDPIVVQPSPQLLVDNIISRTTGTVSIVITHYLLISLCFDLHTRKPQYYRTQVLLDVYKN